MSRLTRSDLGDLNLFRVIARAGGFRRAALELDISASALSHSLRGLEARLGVRLFNRTNRSVTLTEAGENLLRRLDVGFEAIESGVDDLNRHRDKPAGRLRINVLTDAARLTFAPALSQFIQLYPEVNIEIVVEDGFIDIVSGNFDAGIRFGGSVPEEMIAVPISTDLRWIMVASPEYLDGASPLANPEDLNAHRCIGLRTGTGAIYHWELENGSDRRQVSVDWAIMVNETALAIEIASTGGGIAYCLERRVANQLKSGALKEVLPEWGSHGPAFHIYYTSRRQVPSALRALIDFLKNEAA